MPSFWGGGQKMSTNEIIIAVIIVIIIIVAVWYFFYKTNCKSQADCTKAGQVCNIPTGKTAGRCGAPPAAKAGFRKSKAGFRKQKFNSDEMNWPTAGSLVPGDTFPYGNYSGYDVQSFGTSYDQLYR